MKKFFTKHIQTIRDDCSGAMTIEMALVATATFFIMPILIDITTTISSGINLSGSLRAGAQVALVQPSNTEAIGEAVAVSSGFDASLVTVGTSTFCECDGIAVQCTTTTCSGGTTPSTFMTITADYDTPTYVTYPGGSNPFAITRSTTIRVR